MHRPKLSETRIVKWAKAHFEQTGKWPTRYSGGSLGEQGDSWRAVDRALRAGSRGLPDHSSLFRLLEKAVGWTGGKNTCRLRVTKVVRLAKAHFRQFGEWPSINSGPVAGVANETWANIDRALRRGNRGLRGGDSLARLLWRTVGRSNIQDKGWLSIPQIIAWAKTHHRRSGRWPTKTSGAVMGASDESWAGLNHALVAGRRGLPGGETLAGLLCRRVGKRQHHRRTRLTHAQIITWAREHFVRSGGWPEPSSGLVAGGEGDTWHSIDGALRSGHRGLPGGSSLCRLLGRAVGRPDGRRKEPLARRQILDWAQAHFERTGRWPSCRSGAVVGVPGETWLAIDDALKYGFRGLPGGDSLTGLLDRAFGSSRKLRRRRLTIREVVDWARAHRKRFGRWPTKYAGAVEGAPGETWSGVNHALQRGDRGLPGGDTLAKVLDRYCGRPHGRGRREGASRAGARKVDRGRDRRSAGRRGAGPMRPLPKRPLKLREIILWARAHYRRTGRWPEQYDGRVADAKGETWFGIDEALRRGLRGLPAGSSLREQVRGLRKPRPILTCMSAS